MAGQPAPDTMAGFDRAAPALGRAAARRQVLRAAQDGIGRQADTDEQAERLSREALDRLDFLEFEADLAAGRPPAALATRQGHRPVQLSMGVQRQGCACYGHPEQCRGRSVRDIQQVGGSCHCGAVRFHVKLTHGLHTARRCTCSYCRMRGAVAVSANLDGLAFIAGADALSAYQFNSMTARHYFCSKCGIHTHHQRRSNPAQYGVNVACLDGLSPFDFDEVDVLDGVNHPADGSAGPRRAGVLRFVPAE